MDNKHLDCVEWWHANAHWFAEGIRMIYFHDKDMPSYMNGLETTGLRHFKYQQLVFMNRSLTRYHESIFGNDNVC